MQKFIQELIDEYDKVLLEGYYYRTENVEESCRIEVSHEQNDIIYRIVAGTMDKKNSSEVKAMLENAAVFVCDGKVNSVSCIYEDSNGIQKNDFSDLTGKLVINSMQHIYSKKYYDLAHSMNYPKKFCNYDHFYSRIAKMDKKLSVGEAFEYFKKNPEEFVIRYRSRSDMKDPVISVTTPDITRKQGNDNKDTFDFVSVELLLRSDLGINDMRVYIRENIRMLNEKALEKISKSKTYQKYDVPISYLKLYSVANHTTTLVRLMYELK